MNELNAITTKLLENRALKIATCLLRETTLKPFYFDYSIFEWNKTRDQHLETGTKIRDQIVLAAYV